MGSHQDGAHGLGLLGRIPIRYLFFLIIVISTGFLSHTITSQHVGNEHAAQVNELRAIIHAHRKHLETRDAIDVRGLASAFGDFISGASSAAKSAGSAIEGAASKLLPNSTTVLNDLVSLVTGGGNTSTIIDSLGEPAGFLGVGLSTGALTGLNMTAPPPSANMTGVNMIAANLGSGLTSTIFSSSSVKGLLTVNMSSDQPGGLLGGSTGTVGQAVLALAQGLSGGAVSGLKLNAVTAGQPSYFNSSGVSGIAGNFGQGLAQTALGSVKIPSLSELMTTLSSSNMTSMINVADVGTGFGAGIGQGAAVGLGLQKDTTDNTTVAGAKGIAQGFAKGLVSNFLANGTLSRIASSLSASVGASTNASGLASASTLPANASADAGGLSRFSLSNVNIAKVAEGFAVGLVSGAGSTISKLAVVSADTTNFDDSVMGASTGFGRGLGTEGGKLVSAILGGTQADMSIPAADSTTSTTNSTTEMQPMTSSEAAAAMKGRSIRKGRGPGMIVAKRETTSQTPITIQNATDLAGVLVNLNATTINPLINYGLDALSCSGVGGFVGIFLGLIESKTLNVSLSSLAAAAMKSQPGELEIGGQNVTLPDQTFIIKSGDNTYSLNPARGVMTVMVNGLMLNGVIGLAVVHILFGILVYFIAIPFIILIQSGKKITFTIYNRPGSTPPPMPVWQLWTLYSLLPLAILVFSAGVGLRGNAKQFSTPHGIFGLILLLQTLLAGVTGQRLKNKDKSTSTPSPLLVVHKANIALLLLVATATLFAGFTDLSSLALCATNAIVDSSIWIAVGWLLTMPVVFAEALEILKLWIWWMGRKVVPSEKMIGGNMSTRKGKYEESVFEKSSSQV